MKNKRPKEISAQLAELLPQMMMQMVRLGDSLPHSAAELTPQQLRVITALDAAKTLRMTALAAELGITQSTLTDASKRLIKMGYLLRERSANDDRVVHISLSAKGRNVAGDLKQARLVVFKKICEKLGTENSVKLLHSHRLIYETYKSLGPVT
jgi:DNA-binding MarR family transcriptional regulator